ncbi:MAG: CHASE2 domain-containing protein [Bacteroidales bacterium]|nr:CHASE2 domain-containing protein [Bacteroidales bacterium]
MAKKKKYSIFWEAFRVNMFVVFTAAFIWVIIDAFDELNPFDRLLDDFDYTDIFYENFLPKEVPPDTNIIIVNIGGYPLGRMDMANQINIIQKYNPKVIGVDAVFAERRGFEDYALKQALNQKDNVVMGVFGVYDDDDLVGYIRSNPFFGEFPFGHLEFQSYPKTTRDFDKYIIAYDTVIYPTYSDIVNEHIKRKTLSELNDSIDLDEYDFEFEEPNYSFADTAHLPGIFLLKMMLNKPDYGFKEVQINAFSTEIMRMYDEEKYEKYMNRFMREEIIHYRGGSMPFIVFDFEEITDTNENLVILKDKIVLLGYVRQNMYSPGDTIDSHFTPMKRSPDGHADAKGIEIHAHILSMIISENYMNHWPSWVNYLLALLINQVFLMLFCYLYVNKTDYFDLTSKPIQFIGILLTIWFNFVVLNSFSFKIDLVPLVICLILSIEVLYLYQEALEVLRIRSYLTSHINFENNENRIIIAYRKISTYFNNKFKRNSLNGSEE